MTKKNTPATRSILRPDDIDPDLWALFKASRQGQERVVRRILRQRPTLLSEEWWYTKALHFAVREGHLSVVRHFLSENDDPLWIRHGSEDLVTIASDRGHDEVVRLLREKLKELNVAQPRPVHSAAKSGDVTTIARLLAKNPSTIDVGDDQGM